MGLLAYKDPANSPLGHLVSSLQNQAIADKVNDAVLGENAGKSNTKLFLVFFKVFVFLRVVGGV